MTSNSEGYWSRSWALLTRSEGWIKPLLVLGAAKLVPIVGPFGADGYALEWARLTAWGVDSSPKQRSVDIPACIKTGARAFVVALGYGLAIALVGSLFTAFAGENLGEMLSLVLSSLVMVLVKVPKLRSAIYQQIGAGFEVVRIADMIKRDCWGLLRVVGMSILLMLGIGIVAGILFSVALVPSIVSIVRAVMEYEAQGSVDDAFMVRAVLSSVAGMLPAIFVLSYVASVLGSFMDLMVTTAVGLWMRQFDVRNWGNSSDPLPQDAPGAYGGAYAQPQAQPYEQPQSYDIQQPVDYQQPATGEPTFFELHEATADEQVEVDSQVEVDDQAPATFELQVEPLEEEPEAAEEVELVEPLKKPAPFWFEKADSAADADDSEE